MKNTLDFDDETFENIASFVADWSLKVNKDISLKQSSQQESSPSVEPTRNCETNPVPFSAAFQTRANGTKKRLTDL